MSTPMRSERIASSLTSAMFTERTMFSSSFGHLGDLGGRHRDDFVAYPLVELHRPLGARRGYPPTTLGVFRNV
jgi:hypothetical protein